MQPQRGLAKWMQSLRGPRLAEGQHDVEKPKLVKGNQDS